MQEMIKKAERAQKILKEHRETIDRLDAILVYTLGERFSQTKAVGKLKAKYKLEASDPLREKQQIERFEELSSLAGLDPVFAKTFLNFIIKEVIRHHRQIEL